MKRALTSKPCHTETASSGSPRRRHLAPPRQFSWRASADCTTTLLREPPQTASCNECFLRKLFVSMRRPHRSNGLQTVSPTMSRNLNTQFQEDTPSNGAEMTWLQKKGEHMISASTLASSQQGLSPSDRTVRKHMEHSNQVTFFFHTDPHCRDMEMKQDEVWQKRLPEFTQTRSAAGR